MAIVVVAAGRGSRVGEGTPKQYRSLAGRCVLAHGLSALRRAAPDAAILPVIHADDVTLYAEAVASLDPASRAGVLAPVVGGASRQESVRAGLEALAAGPDAAPGIVLIHDAARIFASDALIARAVRAAEVHGAAIPGVPVADTIKEIAPDQSIRATPPRAALRAVQTPQAFDFRLILDAHRRAAQSGADGLTDDAAVAEWAGRPVHVFEGDAANMKITSAEDLAAAEARLIRDLVDMRMGQGYDVHALGPGDHVWLGGIKISHDHGLVGHSDADVLSHAVTDALFGALSDGDIGSHFPPSDPQWRGADSNIFLAYAARRVRERGGMIAHVDATVVCERPKVGPHRDAIRASLARTMEISLDRVAVKATTSEKLGFTGREEGIAALAVATVRLPLAGA
ncbi:bifunctional 2-C-methyl-D-erythritol 4-phosphate cytidylyltransferase/2-C-methyl-D-erythritol 2,4-cyclodiphosphate synthase [Methylocella sp.]|uniref:bifunctional 2-C-methyl-D-erythritol 4-phosphate cytidylyltransferase/2-C-methyl-D-erythritol 2,4-cyclodiphosphate synthase n=1 Tax=Methylocella sp. TaxID=1978226 RepID=UPI003782ED58